MVVLISILITTVTLLGLDFLLDKDPTTFLFFKDIKSNLSFGVFVIGIFSIVLLLVYLVKNYFQKKREKQLLDAVELIIDFRRNIEWSKFLSINFHQSQDKVLDLIEKGISFDLFYGSLKDNAYTHPYLEFINRKTVAKLKVISESHNMVNYKYVEKRAEIENKIDTYIYTSDSEKIRLLMAPLNLLKSADNQVYAIYDNSKAKDSITIIKSNIKDIFYEDLTYDKYKIAELWIDNSSKTIEDIKVISVTLKDNTGYELIGSDISLEI